MVQEVPSEPAVLIYAGGSVFGRLLAADLLAHTPARLLLVGPQPDSERAAARELDPTGERVRAAQADLADAAGLARLLVGMDAAVCCLRDFQGVPTTLPAACMAAGVAYFDIADNRRFVGRVLDLRAEIAAAGIAAGTGLGALPGLSALMSEYARTELALEEVARIDLAFYIGSHRARGVGALAAAVRCTGRPIARHVYGWSGRQRADFPAPIGRRKVYTFDAPDYDLFPDLFGVRPDRIRVRLGFDRDLVNRGLAALGLLRRMGWRWRYKGPLLTLLLGLSAPLRAVSEDDGALQASVRGIAPRPAHHAVIRAGTVNIVAPDVRLLFVLPCALAVARHLADPLPPGLLDWRNWLAPEAMWDALRARGLTVTWVRE
ncbi:MAG: saccharopine dehydrogenase NADP-binding domain-containing protein [Chloroflexota bacterium]|nr:saccharopine dehydrogenase NADP-binding domain-containing protein [Chloroflexota bacterium]